MALNSSTAAAMVGSFAASYEIWLVSWKQASTFCYTIRCSTQKQLSHNEFMIAMQYTINGIIGILL